jgi:hypothetical protein
MAAKQHRSILFGASEGALQDAGVFQRQMN